MSIWMQDDFLEEKEIFLIRKEVEPLNWTFKGGTWTIDILDSDVKTKNGIRFWYKELNDSNTSLILKERLERGFNFNIVINRIYMNGQAHSQSGYWHTDSISNESNEYTLVYFLNEWLPEYGGHLMIKHNDDVISYLPKQNRAIIFDSHLMHMGLEPSRHCRTQRESIAVKFKLERKEW